MSNNFFEKLIAKVRDFINLPIHIRLMNDLMLFQQTKQLQMAHPNPLNKYGLKCFSQTDEDGITLEILKRIGMSNPGVFAEFGVGDGTENNTLILAALGWKGFWVGGQDIKFNWKQGDARKFTFLQDWVILDNILDLTEKGLSLIDEKEIDVISLDLDGNDLFFIDKLLSNGMRPKLFIAEYNAKFIPPVEFTVAYDAGHVWSHDDYFGTSLTSLDKLFTKFDYKLVCCNSHTGVNAFFVDSKYAVYFLDVPADISQIFVEPRYHLYHRYGHTKSFKTIEKIFGDLNAD
jgi:hypothetical protein